MNKLIVVRNEAAANGRIDKSQDPFSVRNKDFWDLTKVHKVGRVFLPFSGRTLMTLADGTSFSLTNRS